MSERPTPETDAFFRTFADAEATPSHAEYYDRMTKLERERDAERALADLLASSLLLTLSAWITSPDAERAAAALRVWKEARSEI